MAIDSQTVDLVIRSKLQGSADLKRVATDLAGIEKAIDAQAKSAQKGEAAVDDLRVSLDKLKQVQEALSNQANLINVFQRTTDAASKAETRVAKTGQAYDTFAAKLKEVGAVTDQQQEKLIGLRISHERAQTALTKHRTTLQQTSNALRQAGIDTNNLAAAEDRLRAAAAAVGTQIGRANSAIASFKSGSADTNRVVAGLRSEVAGLAAAFIGIPAAVNIARGSIDALGRDQIARNQLGVAAGTPDPTVVGAEMDYARQQASRYGVALDAMVGSYARFAIAAKSAGYEQQQVRFSFESLTGAMRTLGMNGESMGRAFTQIQQILGKTKPEIEDLNTIAESGFIGVRNLIANGLRELGVAGIRAGSEVQDMGRMMESGLLDSQTAIYALAVASEKAFAQQLPEALKSLQAEQGRFQTSVQEFQKGVGVRWADDYTAALKRVRDALGSVEGEAIGSALATIFRTAVSGVEFLIAAIGGIRTSTINVVSWFDETRVRAVGTFELLGEGISSGMARAWQRVRGLFGEGLAFIANTSAKAYAAIGATGAAEALRKIATDTIRPLEEIADRTEEISARIERDLAAIAAARNDALNYSTPAAPAAVATARPGTAPRRGLGGDDGKAAKKLATEVKSIESALAALELKTQKAEADTLSARLALVQSEYKGLADRIAKLGGPAGAEFGSRFNTALDAELARVRQDFEKLMVEQQKAVVDAVDGARAAVDKRERTSLESRLAAVRTGYMQAYDQIEKYRLALAANGRDTGDAGVQKARLDGIRDDALAQEESKFRLDELKRVEQELAQTLDTRRQRLSEINDLETAGALTAQQAADKRVAVLTAAQTQIEQLRASNAAWIESVRGLVDPVTLDLLVAKLDAAAASAGQFNDRLFQIQAGLQTDLSAGVTDSLVDGLTTAAEAGEGFKGTIQSVGTAFATMARDFLTNIAKMILQQQILNALKSYGAFGGAAGAVAGVMHSGGLVGHHGAGRRSRAVDPSWFASAPRYHSGGVAGLAPDEYATVLQRNEEVLSASSPRNVMNWDGVGKASEGGSNRFVLVDDRSKVPEAMSSAEGERVIVEVLHRNAATLKQLVR